MNKFEKRFKFMECYVNTLIRYEFQKVYSINAKSEKYLTICNANIKRRIQKIILNVLYQDNIQKIECDDKFVDKVKESYQLLECRLLEIIRTEIIQCDLIIKNYERDKEKIDEKYNKKIGEILNIESGYGDIHNNLSTCKVIC